MEISRLTTRDGTAEPASRNQIVRRERGQGSINFPCSADHVQDWLPYPVDPYSCYMCDHTYIHTYIVMQGHQSKQGQVRHDEPGLQLNLFIALGLGLLGWVSIKESTKSTILT